MENKLELPFIYGFDDVQDLNDQFSEESVWDEDGYLVGKKPIFPENADLLVAVYTYECYEGNAFVLYEQDGKLFEVNGSHCSCNGLEGLFIPEETTWEALLMRSFSDSWSSDSPWNLIRPVIGILAAERGVFPKLPQKGKPADTPIKVVEWDPDSDEFPF